MKYESLKNDFFTENRKRFAKQMKKNSMAVFVANEIMPRSADASYKWRQSPDLFYLSGIDQEETMLIIFPDAPQKKWREILFVRETNEHIKTWEGEKLTIMQASEVSGIETVFWSKSFDALLHTLALQADAIYLNTNENDRAVSEIPTADIIFADKIKQKFPLHQLLRAAPIMAALRTVKSKYEIALTQKAVDITHSAFERILQYVKPGVWEYEIEAEMIHEFIRNKSTGHAFDPIVATGANACVLHYVSNNKQCKTGDLVLLDFGAEYANYNADMTRTIPVSGKFTKRQKEVYNAVLSVMKQAKSMMKPGISLFDFNNSIGEVMEAELVKLKLLKTQDIKNQQKNNPLYKKYFPHGTSHFLGLDVHDIGDRYAKLPSGALLTCEPGIYIPEEGIGIRLENDIYVTSKGNTDLMEKVPLEAEAIEEWMNKKTK